MMHTDTDTIAAIATPPGNGGIAIVRLSGEDALNVARRVFKSRQAMSEQMEFRSHHMNFGDIYDGDEKIDEGFLCYMRSPHTYTGEDCIEFHIHGGQYLAKRVLQMLLADSRARMAQPGEFTKRAFLNGKMDLTQSEAVIDLINVKTEMQRKIAIQQLSGLGSNKIKAYRNILEEIVIITEANIDFPEYVPEGSEKNKVKGSLMDIVSGVKTIINDSKKSLKWCKTAIIQLYGPVNVGKSSLFNAIIGESKAIVSEYPGTTRDAIEIQLDLRGFPVTIVDGAGYRHSDDAVEKLGLALSEKYFDKADLVIYVFDITEEISFDSNEILQKKKDGNSICILNKSDLSHRFHVEHLKSYFCHDDILLTSAKTGIGISEVIDKICSKLLPNSDTLAEACVVNERHLVCLSQVIDSLSRALESIDNDYGDDLISSDIRHAIAYIDEMTGVSATEDLLGQIFSRFCIGK
ncbi:MAG: tRNA uridine-5-carboxymethylaminomethyl(34) synthesis GTPase MnmE [Chlamydiota bacterium]|nr:tRNA uridine-5-carboxymethylaminomethyl(34) synthesis GTPase MnmE [Chlamydiota bacterium]